MIVIITDQNAIVFSTFIHVGGDDGFVQGHVFKHLDGTGGPGDVVDLEGDGQNVALSCVVLQNLIIPGT